MFGPSSSHTAGACRLSRAMWQLLGEQIKEASLELHGSFRTKDSGVINRALVAGLLGFDTDDDRINHSHELMTASGIRFSYRNTVLEGAHNNTVRYSIKGQSFSFSATGSSIGGGMIRITEINGSKLEITGEYNTLVIFCRNTEAILTEIDGIGIGKETMTIESVPGKEEHPDLVLLKSSFSISAKTQKEISKLPNIIHVSYLTRFE